MREAPAWNLTGTSVSRLVRERRGQWQEKATGNLRLGARVGVAQNGCKKDRRRNTLSRSMHKTHDAILSNIQVEGETPIEPRKAPSYLLLERKTQSSDYNPPSRVFEAREGVAVPITAWRTSAPLVRVWGEAARVVAGSMESRRNPFISCLRGGWSWSMLWSWSRSKPVEKGTGVTIHTRDQIEMVLPVPCHAFW